MALVVSIVATIHAVFSTCYQGAHKLTTAIATLFRCNVRHDARRCDWPQIESNAEIEICTSVSQTGKEMMHKTPEGLDKHWVAVVGLLARFFACADKLGQCLTGGGGECG